MILREFDLDTRDFGHLRLARPAFGTIATDPWGVLGCLRGTPWGDRIPVISGEVMSHALHGWALPLMRVLGSPPNGLMRVIPEPFRRCRSFDACVIYRKDVCHPCPKMPDCYTPPGLTSVDQEVAAATVALAWKEGRYVIVVEGEEFVL